MESNRWVYPENVRLIPELPELLMLGHDHIRHASRLGQHSHEGCYEFVFVEKGKASWEIGNQIYSSFAGDVFHTLPGELHRAGFNFIEPSKFWWLIIQAPHADGWLGLLPADADLIREKLTGLPRVVHTGIDTALLFNLLRDSVVKQDNLSVLETRMRLVEFLLLLLQPARQRTLGDGIEQSLRQLIETFTNQPDNRSSVTEMAAAAGISPSHFFRVFQQITGHSPQHYMDSVRMQLAGKHLAESDKPVTEIAFDLGYKTTQHFATVFKRFKGCTPSEWRQGR